MHFQPLLPRNSTDHASVPNGKSDAGIQVPLFVSVDLTDNRDDGPLLISEEVIDLTEPVVMSSLDVVDLTMEDMGMLDAPPETDYIFESNSAFKKRSMDSSVLIDNVIDLTTEPVEREQSSLLDCLDTNMRANERFDFKSAI